MDLQDHTKTGNDGHGVHLCPRCGWPFPNPHPSARHRRTHKKICGTIEGYTNLIGSEVGSDDEHHLDEDLEKTPSPKIEKKKSGNSVGGIEGRSGRSEDDLFSDAVNEFSDSGTSPGLEDRSGSNKTLDKDVFFSFKDAENGGTNEAVNGPIETRKSDASVKIVKTLEKIEETEAKPELTHEAESKTISEETKDVESQTVSESVKIIDAEVCEDGKNVKSEKISGFAVVEKLETETTNGISEGIKHEKIESEHKRVEEVVKEAEIDEIKHDEHVSEIVNERETDETEESKHEKIESVRERVLEVVEKPETDRDQGEERKLEKLESDREQVLEVVKKPETDRDHGEETKHEKFESDRERVLEVFEEREIGHEKIESDRPPEESKMDCEEVVGKPETDQIIPVLTENVLEEPNSVLTEKTDLDASEPEKPLKEHVQEVVKEPDSVLTEKEDLGGPGSEKCSKDPIPEAIEEPKVKNEGEIVAEGVGDGSSDKNARNLVSESIVEENHKPVNNQDSGAALSVDSSSHNSIEGNWGSVSASVDAETLHTNEKSKVNSGKPVAAASQPAAPDVFEPPSFMTLVEQKPDAGSTDVQQLAKPVAPVPVGWFPTLTNVNNASEGRKRNEEVIAKVTSWSTGKHSTPLKSLLGEAKSPSSKAPAPAPAPEEGPAVNRDPLSSPPKLIGESKKARKKSWVPFGCCSSANVVN